MKHFLLLILGIFLLIKLEAQVITENRTYEHSRFYLGVGTGFDNFTGIIGVSGTLNIYENISVRGGLGIGCWGSKTSVGLKFDSYRGGKWSYIMGYSWASGLDDLPLEMETTSGTTREIKVDCFSANTINLSIARNWKVGRSNIFNIEFGYAIPTQGRRWEITDGSTITTNEEKVLDIMQPGGIIFGAGFAFGL
jgi:hypothetical protein